MRGIYLLLDVGGTEIKAGIMNECGLLLKDGLHYPSRAKEDREEIWNNFVYILDDLQAYVPGERILGIGMAFPGPFDYERGISLMQGLDKYDSIYGYRIEDEIKKRSVKIKDCSFCFLHDVEAFAIGVSWSPAAATKEKIICLCLGTGAGSAFIEDHIPIKDRRRKVPENGWIYLTPFKDATIDDYLSVRGLSRISKRYLSEEKTGKELYERCMDADEKALHVYEEFGANLAAAMKEFLEAFEPDVLVLGGQIAKSFSFYGKDIKKICEEKKIGVLIEEDTSLRAMQGLYKKMSGVREEEVVC